MFCPRCGQQQTSESQRFCSGCGFKLNIEEDSLGKRLTKMVLFLVLALCAIMGWASVTGGPGYLQIRVIITLIALISFYLLFSRDLKHIFEKPFDQNIEPAKQIESAGEKSLPPAQIIPASVWASNQTDTAKMAQPLSVTEQTTSLFDKSSD